MSSVTTNTNIPDFLQKSGYLSLWHFLNQIGLHKQGNLNSSFSVQDPSIRDRTTILGEKIRSENGVATAVQIIEEKIL